MTKAKKKKVKFQDFQKTKLKVGKTLPKGQNVVNPVFKTRSIQIKEQLKSSDASQPVTSRKLNLQDLLGQCQHYSTSVKKDALSGLKELLTAHPDIIAPNLANVNGRLSELLLDKDQDVRHVVGKIFKVVFEQISEEKLSPFFPVFSAHLCCAMTHIYDDIRRDSLDALDLCLHYYPSLVVAAGGDIMSNFLEQISRKSTISKTGGGSQDRTLLVNPGSALSTQKWRTKVLDRLKKFLVAVVKSKESDIDISGNQCETEPIRWTSHNTNVQIYDSKAVEHSSAEFRLWSRSGRTEGDNYMLSGVSLQSYTKTLVPLLLECWVEVGPALLGTNLPGNAMSEESLVTLHNVLSVLQLLLQCIARTDGDQSNLMSWVKEKYTKDFTHYFMSAFPFSMHQAPQSGRTKHGKSRKNKKATVKLSVPSLNLTLCDVMSYFMDSSTGQQTGQWTKHVVSYIQDTVTAEKLSTEQLGVIITIIRKLLALKNSDAMKATLLEAMVTLFKKRKTHTGDQKLLLAFFTEIILLNQYHQLHSSPCILHWLTIIPNQLTQFCRQGSWQLTGSLLSVMVQVASRGFNALIQPSRAQCNVWLGVDGDKSILELLPADQQRQMMEVMVRIPEWRVDWLKALAGLCNSQRLPVSSIQYLLSCMHHCLLQSGANGRPASLAMTDYFSFLFSLVAGYSSEQLVDMEKACKRSAQNTKKLTPICMIWDIDDVSWPQHRQVIKCVCETLNLFRNSEQVQEVILALLVRVMTTYSILPLSTSLGVLQLVANCCKTVTVCHNNIDHLLHLTVAALEACITKQQVVLLTPVDDTTSGSEVIDQEMTDLSCDLDLFTELFGRVDGFMRLSVSLVVEQLKLEHTNVRVCIDLLNWLLQCTSLRDKIQTLKTLLADVVQSKQGGHLEDETWWTDFSYAVSLVK